MRTYRRIHHAVKQADKPIRQQRQRSRATMTPSPHTGRPVWRLSLRGIRNRLQGNTADEGFSLIEAIATLVIISTIMLALSGALIQALQSNRERESVIAIERMTKDLVDSVRAMPWDNLGIYADQKTGSGVLGAEPFRAKTVTLPNGQREPLVTIRTQTYDRCVDEVSYQDTCGVNNSAFSQGQFSTTDWAGSIQNTATNTRSSACVFENGVPAATNAYGCTRTSGGIASIQALTYVTWAKDPVAGINNPSGQEYNYKHITIVVEATIFGSGKTIRRVGDAFRAPTPAEQRVNQGPGDARQNTAVQADLSDNRYDVTWSKTQSQNDYVYLTGVFLGNGAKRYPDGTSTYNGVSSNGFFTGVELDTRVRVVTTDRRVTSTGTNIAPWTITATLNYPVYQAPRVWIVENDPATPSTVAGLYDNNSQSDPLSYSFYRPNGSPTSSCPTNTAENRFPRPPTVGTGGAKSVLGPFNMNLTVGSISPTPWSGAAVPANVYKTQWNVTVPAGTAGWGANRTSASRWNVVFENTWNHGGPDGTVRPPEGPLPGGQYFAMNPNTCIGWRSSNFRSHQGPGQVIFHNIRVTNASAPINTTPVQSYSYINFRPPEACLLTVGPAPNYVWSYGCNEVPSWTGFDARTMYYYISQSGWWGLSPGGMGTCQSEALVVATGIPLNGGYVKINGTNAVQDPASPTIFRAKMFAAGLTSAQLATVRAGGIVNTIWEIEVFRYDDEARAIEAVTVKHQLGPSSLQCTGIVYQ
jgi:hypothetical protein